MHGDHEPGSEDGSSTRTAGYARAELRVEVGGRRLVLVPRAAGATVGAFPFAAAVHVVTAADPGPARLSPAGNAARHEALLADPAVRGRPRHATVTAAPDGSHAENGVLLEGLDDAGARALGARFAQDAVFRWGPQDWSVLPCGDGEPTVLGWEVLPGHPGAGAES